MVNTLIETFLTVPMFLNATLRCLTEIGKSDDYGDKAIERASFFISASVQVTQDEEKFIDFFRPTMIQLKTVENDEEKEDETRLCL